MLVMKRAELYDHLVLEVPRALKRAGLGANHCILASRLAVELLRHHGVRAQAVAADLHVLNVPYALAVEKDPSLADTTTWETARIDGAWCVWVSRHEPGYTGHVVVVAENRVLLDLTAHQANRPKKNISAEPFWIEARDFARGERLVLRGDDGCMWIYDPRTKDRDFVRTNAWSAYRVSTRGGQVISERSGPAAPEIASEVRLPLRP